MYLVKFEIYIYRMHKINILHLIKIALYIFLLTALPVTSSIAKSLQNSDFATSPFNKCWEAEDISISGFASDNNYLILTQTNGNVLQINSQDQSQIWVSSIGNRFNSELFIVNDNYYVVSQNTEEDLPEIIIRKINRTTGITEWSNKLNSKKDINILINEKLNRLFIISPDLLISSIQLENGKTIWEKQFTGNLKSIPETNYMVNDETLLLLKTDNNFIKVGLSDGSLIDRKEYIDKTLTTFDTQKDSIIGGDNLGNVYRFQETKPTSKRLFRTGGEIAYIGVFDTHFYTVSNDNYIYLYSTEQNKIKWKRRLPGRVIIKPIFYNKIAIVTTLADPDIYFLETIEGNVVNRIELQNNYIIKDIQQNQGDIFVLTNRSLIKFAEICSK